MKKISTVIEVAEKTLHAKDSIQKSYRAGYNSIEGFLVLSQKRLLFMQRHGFYRSQYHIIVDVPYKKINSLTVEASHRFALEVPGKIHQFTTFSAVTAAIVKQNLEDFMALVS